MLEWAEATVVKFTKIQVWQELVFDFYGQWYVPTSQLSTCTVAHNSWLISDIATAIVIEHVWVGTV